MATRPLVGTSFAGYRVESVLGRGGMSVVYLAEHPRLKNRVALKLLAPSLAEDDLFRERLLRESRLAASLSHPNVIPVYDTGEAEGLLYVSMRYVEGEDLRALLRERGPLPLAETASVISQAAAALDAAHARGLVHRDVKPANILLEPGAEPAGHVYVADFGLTKHTDARSGATASGVVGTVEYMPPEQIEGRQLDARSDVYALGCVLFECLTGQAPFRRDNDVAVLWAHIREEPPRVSDLARGVPRAFDAIVDRALAKSPADRYESCGALATDVRAAAASKRQRPVPLSRMKLPRLRTRYRRRLVPLAAAALVGAAVAAGITAALEGGGSPARAPLSSAALDASLMIPAALQPSCEPTAAPSPDFNASAICHPVDPTVSSVQYSHALSGSRMRARWLAAAYAVGAALPGASVKPQGSCAGATTAARDWGVPPSGTRRELVGSPLPEHGRLLCYTSPSGWSSIEWTDKDFDVYAIAYGHTRYGLYRWWRIRGGPSA
jgi:serine/threonine protein kinase